MTPSRQPKNIERVPVWLLLFCYALLGSAMGINAVLVELAIPAMAPLGVPGLVAAFVIGAALGIFPALWLARQIANGIRKDE